MRNEKERRNCSPAELHVLRIEEKYGRGQQGDVKILEIHENPIHSCFLVMLFFRLSLHRRGRQLNSEDSYKFAQGTLCPHQLSHNNNNNRGTGLVASKTYNVE